MTFLEYIIINKADEIEFDTVIGGVDMPATICLDDELVITDYCMEKYGNMLNSEIIVHKDCTGLYTDTIEVGYDDYKVGEEFCYAMAGYVSDNEWNKLFKGGSE